MKYLLFFLILLFFGLLQSTIIPINFLLLLSILYAVNVSPREGFYWAFIAGILRDLLLGYPIGPTSVYFLAMVFLLNLYRRKYKLSHFTYILPFTVLALLMSYLLFSQSVNLLNIIISVIVFVVLSPLVRAFMLRFDEKTDQLKLME